MSISIPSRGRQSSLQVRNCMKSVRKLASVSAWKSIRQGALKAVTETNTMPKNQICIFCWPYLDVCSVVTVSTFCVSCLPICSSRIV